METLAIITGASSGIGAALVRTIPFSDATVIDVSRSGGNDATEHWALDLADPAAWADLEHRLVARLQGFAGRAVCIHNAGTLDPIGFAGEVDSADYTAQVLVNSAAPQAVGHAFLKALAGAGEVDAHLLVLSSGAASKPYEGWSAYCAGKAAVDHWVRTVGAEQARRAGAQVLAVAPGVVATPMQSVIRSTDERDFPSVGKFIGLHESGELREPDEAAAGIWSLIGRPLDNGSVVDLRDIG